VRHLLATKADAMEMVRRLDYRTVAPLEAALVEAAGQNRCPINRQKGQPLRTSR